MYLSLIIHLSLPLCFRTLELRVKNWNDFKVVKSNTRR